MGFECGFIKLPKFSGITPLQAVVSGEYFEYKKWLKSEWAQKQIQNGSELTFKGYYGMNEADLPKKSVLDEYEKVFYKKNIDSYCSDGHNLDQKILHSSAEAIDKNKMYFLMSSDLIRQLCKEYEQELNESRLEPVYISNAYVINDKGRKELISIDGLELEFQDGTIRRISSEALEEEQLFASTSYYDSDKRRFIEKVTTALDGILTNTDWDKEYIIYVRSF